MNILLAEDCLEQRHAYAQFLKAWGHEVAEASNGEEALSLLLHPDSFDALISDYNMPRMNGVELILEMDHRHIRLPLVVLFSGTTFENKDISQLRDQISGHQPFYFVNKDADLSILESLLKTKVENSPEILCS